METHLTIKHLAPYLPYGLSTEYKLGSVISLIDAKDEVRTKVLTASNVDFVLNFCKPFLRSLSYLTKEIEVNGEKFVPIHRLKQGGTDIVDFYVENGNYSCYDNEGHETFYDSKRMCFFNCYRGDLREFQEQYNAFQKLLEWHFDIFSLIDAGLAVDINTVKF